MTGIDLLEHGWIELEDGEAVSVAEIRRHASKEQQPVRVVDEQKYLTGDETPVWRVQILAGFLWRTTEGSWDVQEDAMTRARELLDAVRWPRR